MTPRLPILAVCLLAACRSAQPFEGLAPAVQTGGPKIVFDLARRPLPEIPFPNDLATRPDATSPTGLRVNASLVAPSQVERNTRALLDQLDGFGTYAPITVAFDNDLDLADLFRRQNNADATDDGVYLVEIATGSTVALDFGSGRFPYVLANPGQYFVNDAFAQHLNLLFPGCGAGANVLVPPGPACGDPDPRLQADQLLGFYERETHTLVMRPALPLKQETRYAVLLTDRVHDAQARAIVPPGSGINHPGQTSELRPVLDHLPAGLQKGQIAYAWAFTTQTTTRDLEAIQAGLQIQGRLALLGAQYPVEIDLGGGVTRTTMSLLPERDRFATTDPLAYILPADELFALLQDPAVLPLLGSPDANTVNALRDTFKYVAYFVSGSFLSPNLLDAPDQAPQDGTFQIDLLSRQARSRPATVTFLLAVPKPNAGHKQPFPTVIVSHGYSGPFPAGIVGHGYTGTRSIDMLGFAGTFAKFGLASIAIDAFGHGLDPTLAAGLVQAAQARGLGGFATALLQGRARDLDNDGILDSGGDLWSASLFHTRDVVRQSVADQVQLVRLLRSFDGHNLMAPTTLAGDFDNDGRPDVAGPPTWPFDVPIPGTTGSFYFRANDPNPGSDLFAFGVSLGGIVSGILPAVEPSVKAAASVSGAGGLSDVALRSSLPPVVQAVFLELFGPIFADCDYSPGLQRCSPGAPDAQPALVMIVPDVNREKDLPVAPLALAPGDRVTLRNLSEGLASGDCDRELGCAAATADAAGHVRLAVAANWPTLSATSVTPPAAPQVKVLQPGDRLQLTVQPASGGVARVIDTFQFDTSFYGVTYRAGDALTAPARGYGYTRNTPDLRRLLGLSQMILDPGDPINYAPHYFLDPLPARSGQPVPVLVVGTVGDPAVPINTAIAMARAAGLVEMTRPDPDFNIPIDQVLIRAGVVEGVANLQRFKDPAAGPPAALGAHVDCSSADCTGDVLIDPSSYSLVGASSADGLNAPRLVPALRQQLVRTVPLSDGTQAVSALLLPYLKRTGQHGFVNPQPDKPFDMDQFMANLIGRFFETRGRELHFEPCQTQLSVSSPGCPWIPDPPP